MEGRRIQKAFNSVSLKTMALLERLRLTEHTFMIIIAIIIGILGGFAGIGIRAMILWISEISFGAGNNFLENVLNTSWY